MPMIRNAITASSIALARPERVQIAGRALVYGFAA
jgi:hypothetical protein